MKHNIIADGLRQALKYNAPPETILALRYAILEQEMARIAALGGHQGELAHAALEMVEETIISKTQDANDALIATAQSKGLTHPFEETK